MAFVHHHAVEARRGWEISVSEWVLERKATEIRLTVKNQCGQRAGGSVGSWSSRRRQEGSLPGHCRGCPRRPALHGDPEDPWQCLCFLEVVRRGRWKHRSTQPPLDPFHLVHVFSQMQCCRSPSPDVVPMCAERNVHLLSPESACGRLAVDPRCPETTTAFITKLRDAF